MPLWFSPGSGIANIVIGTSTITGGADTQILLNDGGKIGSNSGLAFDKTTGNLTSAGSIAAGGASGAAYGINIKYATDSVMRAGIGVDASGNPFVGMGAGSATRDVFLFRGGPGVLAQRNGANAQGSQLYNVYTDALNNEYGTFDWTSTANTLTIGTVANGTGSARGVNFVAGGGIRMSITASGAVAIFSGTRIATDQITLAVGSGVFQRSNYIFGWSNTTTATSGFDTGLSRTAAGVVAVGNGTAGDASGTLRAATISTSSTTLHTTTAALSNGAAAATGTLTNAPTAGNPTKWVPISDNGTTRYIPAW